MFEHNCGHFLALSYRLPNPSFNVGSVNNVDCYVTSTRHAVPGRRLALAHVVTRSLSVECETGIPG